MTAEALKKDTAPFTIGEEVEIVHMNGSISTVVLTGLYGNKMTMAYVKWGHAGEYRINFSTGQLLPRKASMWRLTDQSMDRLNATRLAILKSTSDRMKAGR